MRSLDKLATITYVVVYFLIAGPALLQGAVEYESDVCHGIGEFERVYYNATCKTAQSTDLIAFRTLSYGYKADATCRPLAVREDCCHYAFGDCMFETNDQMDDLLDYCAGAHSCQRRSHRESAAGRCPIINDAIPYTLFGKVIYECINVGLLVDVCGNHIKTNDELYLAREIFYKTPVAANTKCNCVITTACHTKVKLEAIAVNLVEQDGDCSKYLSIQDFYGGNNETLITCADGYLHSFSTIFTSSGYGVRLALFNESSDDHIWIKASAEDSEEDITIHCGIAVDLPTNHEEQCQTTRETTTTAYETTITTELPTTAELLTTEDDILVTTKNETSTIYVNKTTEKMSSTTEMLQGLQAESQMWYGWGIIGGVVAGVVLAFIIIFIFLLVWRRRKRSTETDEPIYDDPMFHYSASSQEGIVVAENQMYQNVNSDNLEQEQITGQHSGNENLDMKRPLPAVATAYNNYVDVPQEKEASHPPDDEDDQPYENVSPEDTTDQWHYNNAFAGDETVVDKAALYIMNDSEDENMDDKRRNMDADDDYQTHIKSV